MSLVTTKKLLLKAKENHYAVGAFNFTTLEQLKAIVRACENLKTGCILATSETAIKFMGIKNIVDFVKNEIENSFIEYSLHLDHGKSFDICSTCINAGYTSVMIDASSLSFEDNINLTKKVVDYAKKFNVSVEGELGKIQGVEDCISSAESIFTSPKEALEFIQRTSVDSLAISIGTSHGAYKFKGESKLDIERLKQIDLQTNHFPLVLHGASSVSEKLKEDFCSVGGELGTAKGVDDKSIIDAINGGICKINVDTDLRIAFTTGVRKCLLDEKIFGLREYLNLGIDYMQKEVENRIRLFNNNVNN